MRATAIGLVVVVAAAFLLIVGITRLTDKGAPNNETDKSVNVVLDDLDKVQGKRVAVEGDVKTRVAPWAVLVGSSDATQVGLLVIAAKRLPTSVRQATHIQAIGVAMPFSLAAFRRAHPELTGRELRRSTLTDLDGQPALVSARVAVTAPVG
jgi:hypothetical protein